MNKMTKMEEISCLEEESNSSSRKRHGPLGSRIWKKKNCTLELSLGNNDCRAYRGKSRLYYCNHVKCSPRPGSVTRRIKGKERYVTELKGNIEKHCLNKHQEINCFDIIFVTDKGGEPPSFSEVSKEFEKPSKKPRTQKRPQKKTSVTSICDIVPPSPFVHSECASPLSFVSHDNNFMQPICSQSNQFSSQHGSLNVMNPLASFSSSSLSTSSISSSSLSSNDIFLGSDNSQDNDSDPGNFVSNSNFAYYNDMSFRRISEPSVNLAFINNLVNDTCVSNFNYNSTPFHDHQLFDELLYPTSKFDQIFNNVTDINCLEVMLSQDFNHFA